MKVLIYTDANYEYQAKYLIESIRLNHKKDIHILYYTIGFKSDIEYSNVIKIEYDIDPEIEIFNFYKPSICLDAIERFGGNILYLDSDIILGRRFDFDYYIHDKKYPMLGIGNWEFPYYSYEIDKDKEFPIFDIDDRVWVNRTDSFGSIESIDIANETYRIKFIDDNNTYYLNIAETDIRKDIIHDSYYLMKYLNVEKQSMSYLYSHLMAFNDSCKNFFIDVNNIVKDKELQKHGTLYFPFTDETPINVMLWKHDVKENYGRISLNTVYFESIKTVEENDFILDTNINNSVLEFCQDSSKIQYYHGLKDKNELEKTINYLKTNNQKNVNKTYHDINREDLLSYLFINRPGISGVEVGTFKGDFSKEILKNSNVDNLYMVDVWRPLSIEEYDDASNHENHKDAYREAMENTKEFVDRAHMLRCKSNIACNLFADESLDFVYIDANHTYNGVKEDISYWYNKVKKGGIFFGHDYLKLDYADSKDLPIYTWSGDDANNAKYAGMFGVNPAVDEFALEHGYHLNLTNEFTGTWWVIKK